MKCKVGFGNIVRQADLLNKLVQPDPADSYVDEDRFRYLMSPQAPADWRVKIESNHHYLTWYFHPQGSGFFIGGRTQSAMFIIGGRKSIPAFIRTLYVAGRSVGVAWNQRANGLSLQFAREESHWYNTSTRSIVQIAAYSETHTIAGLGRGRFIEGSPLYTDTTGAHRGITFENLASVMTEWLGEISP